MTELPRISVVVPTYNRLDTLRYVIPALVAQDLPEGSFEIVVADSNSNDGTAEFLAETAREHPQVRHLPGPYTGRASARNAGIAAARAPVVFFIDADIIASSDLLARHLAHHDAPGTRAVVGMEVQVSSYDDYVAKRDDAAKRDPLHGEAAKRLSWLYFLTGNASVPKAMLERVGRFDEDFTGYGHGPAFRSSTSRARSITIGTPYRGTSSSRNTNLPAARRCGSSANIPVGTYVCGWG
jgi:glycosyltransferase involved in cell wall biosynthesis